jgi:homoprotocatechuate degradation regulator HpaR
MKQFERSLPMMLYKTLDAVMPDFRAIYLQHGVTEQQWRVLRVLWEHESMPMLELAELTLISPPSLVGIIDRLSKMAMVKRVRSTRDRRVVYITITQKGVSLKELVSPKLDAAYATLEKSIDKQLWAKMMDAMNKIIEAKQTSA